ncbi:NADH dehydrogenase [Bacillus thuringiensis]|uniref:VirD4-like conjugal transfer protein, CD1115 family n=1 Tax=Bacillus thuringiensis TaxID=1428 RepID=UPI0018CCC78C|nr:type IV secretory system conjugative DNA transfer family protein [Bacillus thuringiensis]MBG9503722.1 NADH dehydrogenase [Bacillus thuringiensis]MBG9504244.1 NADH dehydrogenase [Bacillus thuringiensis]
MRMKEKPLADSRKTFWVSVGMIFSFCLLIDYVVAFGLRMIDFLLEHKDELMELPDGTAKDFAVSYLTSPIETVSFAIGLELYQYAQLILLGIFAYTTFQTWRKLKPHTVEDASEYGGLGSASLSDEVAIFDEIDITDDRKEEGTVLAVYNDKLMIHKEDSFLNRHVCVIGGSGSGKTKCYILNNVVNTKNKSIVVSDPKGEIYELTSREKREQGYEVYLINFSNMALSDMYNSIDYVGLDQDAEKFATTLVLGGEEGQQSGDSFWQEQAVSLITAGILYVRENLPKEQHSMEYVYNLLTEPSEKELKNLFANLEEESSARIAFGVVKNATDKTWGGIVSNAAKAMKLWKLKSVRTFSKYSSFKLADIGKRKIALYVVIPLADRTYRALINTFFAQLFQELCAYADTNHNTLDIPVRFLLDEFANIGKMPDFAERLSTVRSYGMEVSIIAQSIGQLMDRYGEKQTGEIMSNCDTTLFLGTNDLDTAKYFSERLGVTTKRLRNDSQTPGEFDSNQQAYTYVQRPLKTPDELLNQMKNNDCYVFQRGRLPIHAQKAWVANWFADQVGEKANMGWHLKEKSAESSIPKEEKPKETVESSLVSEDEKQEENQDESQASVPSEGEVQETTETSESEKQKEEQNTEETVSLPITLKRELWGDEVLQPVGIEKKNGRIHALYTMDLEAEEEGEEGVQFLVQKNPACMMTDIEFVPYHDVKETEEQFLIQVKEAIQHITLSLIYKEQKRDFSPVEHIEEKEAQRRKEQKEKTEV